MKLKFWGTRGSIPRAMTHDIFLELLSTVVERAQLQGVTELEDFMDRATIGDLGKPLSYGGNTPCAEISAGEQSIFVDMGSGLRDAGTAHLGKRNEFTFFMTHLHMDHLLGLPFFVPVFLKGTKITIYHVHKTAPKIIKNLFDGITFPLKWEDLDAEFEFIRINPYDTVTLGDIKVGAFTLDHPGGSFGYRFESGGKVAVIGYDGEYKRNTREDLGRDLPYYQGVDVIAFDAQYELEELVKRFDWGHCSAPIGIDLAVREGIRKLVLFHHDPWGSEDKLLRYFKKSESYLRTVMKSSGTKWPHKDLPNGPELEMAYDGLEVDLGASPSSDSSVPSVPSSKKKKTSKKKSK